MLYNLDYSKVTGITVFLEQRSTRMLVGTLERVDKKYRFTYNTAYLNYKKAIPLGPELPLTQPYFEAEKIFPSFEDRIPSKENPKYPDYCQPFGVDPNEEDIIVLLGTIGKRGPSSFMFELNWDDSFSREDLKKFRKGLGLSTRDFAEGFGISHASIVRIENKKTSGADVLKLLDILHKFPDAAAYYVEKYATSLHSKTREKLLTKLTSKELGCWDNHVTDREYGFSKEAGEILKNAPWAKAMLETKPIQQALEHRTYPYKQSVETTKSALFEIRFARALYEAGLTVEYEHQTGLGQSSVDFRVSKPENSDIKWLIELTSLDKSEAIKEAVNEHEGLFTYSSSIKPEDTTNSPEVRDIIKTQNAILHKTVDRNGNPAKFPERTDNCFHAIIVDMRAFNMGLSDFGDFLNILYGSGNLPDSYQRAWINKDGKKELIRGLFDEEYPDARSQYLRKRIHAIGFVKEKSYERNEIKSAIKLYANPELITNKEQMRNLWPEEMQQLWPL